MDEFVELWENGPLFAQAEHFKMGTDCILLANYINVLSSKKGIDLGCASGAILLLLLERKTSLHMTGLELLPEAADVARKNLEVNRLSDRGEIIVGDIREHRSLFPSGSFDLVVSNPPYFPASGGLTSPDPSRASARSELNCTLEDLCSAAEYLCRSGGTFAVCHKPERLSELLCCMTKHGIEPKRLRLVCHKEGSAPNLVLVEGKRGGRPGLKIDPCLILRNSDGTETDEIKQIYHRV